MSESPSGSGARLVRQLGAGSAIAVVVGSTIGSGIFRSPAGIAEKLPGPGPMLLVWIVGGLFALCGALTLMEVGGAYPYAGGPYVYLREAYGRLPAFLFGWSQLVMIRPASLAAVALVFGEYALRVARVAPDADQFKQWSTWIAIGALVVVSAVNYRGVKWGAAVQNLTTVAKSAGLIVLIVLALAIGLPSNGGNFVPSMPAGSLSVSAFGLALVSVLWAFDGWADVGYVGGEVANPRRNVPRAILWGTLAVTGLYLLANIGYLSVLSVGEIADSDQVAATAMERLVGPAGLVFIVATVMISTFGTLNGSMMTSPRIFYALADDRLFFPAVARVHGRFQTPYVSTVLACGLGIVYVSFLGFSQLTDAFVTAMVPFYGLSVASIFVFRRRARAASGMAEPSFGQDLPPDAPETETDSGLPNRPPYDPPVRAPLYPIAPALFVLSTLFLLGNAIVDPAQRTLTLWVLGGILAGAPVYFVFFGRRAKP